MNAPWKKNVKVHYEFWTERWLPWGDGCRSLTLRGPRVKSFKAAEAFLRQNWREGEQHVVCVRATVRQGNTVWMPFGIPFERRLTPTLANARC